MAARKFYVDSALHSYARLMEIIRELTEEEVRLALAFESETRRRKSIMRRLIGRAARLNELKYVTTLKKESSHAT